MHRRRTDDLPPKEREQQAEILQGIRHVFMIIPWITGDKKITLHGQLRRQGDTPTKAWVRQTRTFFRQHTKHCEKFSPRERLAYAIDLLMRLPANDPRWTLLVLTLLFQFDHKTYYLLERQSILAKLATLETARRQQHPDRKRELVTAAVHAIGSDLAEKMREWERAEAAQAEVGAEQREIERGIRATMLASDHRGR